MGKASKPISKNLGYQTQSIPIACKGQNPKLIIDVNFGKKKINLVQVVLVHSKNMNFLKNKRNVNNLIVCCNFFSPWNTTLLNSDSSLVNHPGETRSHCENNVSVIEKTSLQSAQNQSSILLSFNNKAKREAEIIWSLFCV